MSRLLYLLILVATFPCEGQKAIASLVGTYELLEDTATFPRYKRYDHYTVGETEISYATGSKGTIHYNWKGFYTRKDSLLDVLIYFSSSMDGNIGWITLNTRQKKIQLVVREEGEVVQLVRRNPPQSPPGLQGIFIRLKSLPQPEFTVYAKKSDSAKFYPIEPANCKGYMNNHSSVKLSKKWKKNPTYRAEMQVNKLLSRHLKAELKLVPIDPNPRKKNFATVLLKMNTMPGFPLPDVTLISNSTLYSKERLEALFNSFLAKKLKAIDNPDLQEYLLVTIFLQERRVCVLPPARSDFSALN